MAAKLIILHCLVSQSLSWPYHNIYTVHMEDKWEELLPSLIELPFIDRPAYDRRDKLHFLLSGLEWMSVVAAGFPPVGVNSCERYLCYYNSASRHQRGMSTACQVNYHIYHLNSYIDVRSVHDPYCIFPSPSLEGQGVYYNPYYGGLDCHSFSKFDFLDEGGCYCTSGYEYYVLYINNSVCAISGYRCLWNTGEIGYSTRPFIDLPQPGGQNIWSSSYILHDYFSITNNDCFWANCEPFIFVSLSDQGLDLIFGGWYSLEPQMQSGNGGQLARRMGFGQYRHVKYHRYIAISMTGAIQNQYDNADTTNFPYHHYGDWPVHVTLREMDWNTGVAMATLIGDIEPRGYYNQPGFINSLSTQRNPNNADYFCIYNMMRRGIVRKPWRWAKGNLHGKPQGAIATNVTIEKGIGPPLRAPCGIGYRASENHQISSGRQPWIVKIALRRCSLTAEAQCTGTIVSPRHVVTAASCYCSHLKSRQIFGHGDKCAWAAEGDLSRRFIHHYDGKSMDDRACILFGERDPQGRTLVPNYNRIIWVAFHESFTHSLREYDVSVMGLKFSIMFNPAVAPICLPDPQSSDTNNLPLGSLLYSIKALSTDNENLYKGYLLPSTNPNGHSVYEQCETPCNKTESLMDYLLEIENSDQPSEVFRTFPLECQQFWTAFLDPNNTLRSLFHRGWLEPQAWVNLNIIRDDENKTVRCYDVRREAYRRVGWCKTKLIAPLKRKEAGEVQEQQPPPNSFFGSWGYCDDSAAASVIGTLMEVETTLVPNEECDMEDGQERSRKRRALTRVCTQYVPHFPSTYEVLYFERTGKYELVRYLGGYYREYVPRIYRRKKRIRYDMFGHIINNDDAPDYHTGFPQKHQICHKDDSDVGAPTYARLARLHESNLETRDTTQEPSGQGVSHNVLIAIQTGVNGAGKICDPSTGSYSDVETVLTSDLVSFIEGNINSMKNFKQVFDLEEFKVKLRGQSTTERPGFRDENLPTLFPPTLAKKELDKWGILDFDKLPSSLERDVGLNESIT